MASRFGPGRYEFMAGKRNYGNLETQIDAIIAKTEKRMLALQRESIQRTIDIAQTPVSKGGKMRVDTGFLRASGQGSLTGMPTGPVRGDKAALTGQYDDGTKSTLVLTLANMKLGATFFFGWTAEYSRYREAFDGFLESAMQRWPQTVAEVTEEIKKRIR